MITCLPDLISGYTLTNLINTIDYYNKMKKKLIHSHIRQEMEKSMSYCLTPHSRINNRGKSGTEEMHIPLFDVNGFERDLPRLYLKSTSLDELINNFQLFYDTYFYPASLISLVLIDDHNQPAQVFNAKTFTDRSRDLEDWQLDNPSSIASHAIFHTDPGTIYNFIDASSERVNGFFQIPADFFSKTASRIVDIGSMLKNCTVRYSDMPSITDYNLLRKEMSEFIDTQVCSAIIASLWNDKKLYGGILIGTDIYHLYTRQKSAILGPEHLMFLQLTLQHLAISLANIKSLSRGK